MLISALLCGACTYCVNKFLLKSVYQAKVSLYLGSVKSSDEQSSSAKQGTAELVQTLNIGIQLANDFRELLNSARIKQFVAKRMANVPEYSTANFTVSANLIKQSRLIDLTVTSTDKLLCCKLANAYLNASIEEIGAILNLQNIKAIDTAEVPDVPISPNVMGNTAIFVFLGALVCYGVFCLICILDNTIKNPDEAIAKLNQPLIGTIPLDERLQEETRSGNFIVALENTAKNRCNISEHFRSMRVNLQYDSIGSSEHGRVIVVTSSIPGEGKSFNSSNLAASLAESGKRTLLINCDLRKPSLQKIFDYNHETGLVNVLVGEAKFDEVVVHDLFENIPLDVLFCGPIPPNPSKLLISDAFVNLIKLARDKYDYVILDTPPNLAIADATIIGGCADGVLLVVRANFTNERLVQQAILNLKQAKLNIIGIILNRFSSALGNGYGYGYSYGEEAEYTPKK